MSRFNLNIYFALDAILSNPTLTQAARSISLSQPAMSLALKRLREMFGDELVRYHYGETEFTPLALLLKPLVADVLARSHQILDLSRSFDSAHADRIFRLMAPAATLFVLLPPLLAKLAVDAPRIAIETNVLDREMPTCEERFDLSVVPAWAAPEATSQDIVLEENFSCLVPVDAGLQSLDEQGFLAMEHAALAETEDLLFWRPDSGAGMLMRNRHVVARTSRLDALPHLAVNRRLVITATTRFTQHHAALLPRLISIPAPDCLSRVKFVKHVPPGRVTEPAVRWFAGQVEQVCGQLSPAGLSGLRD